ncbi:phosphotransferase [Alcanivorax hongdengensis A-11-3]|uniref:histidine kinase n=1 Tax=Alcanivorax hongdengensis A-11-3 TaxID=1177179 RepID=L0WB90_9GAMM|nr:ATP-binding protein [Alcanivorax hongdengensis]EKF74236.1 phosphotransferase [Alcanivorax hongdengensis A-11-3]
MGIRNKLFLIFLATFLVLIAAGSGFSFYAFQRSLNTYLDERQQAKVERLADHLGMLYSQSGSWEFLLRNPRQLKRLYILAGDRDEDDKTRGLHHLQLLGENKRPLLGPPAPPGPPGMRIEVPVHAGHRTVGWLTYPNQDAIRDKLDQRFMGRQVDFGIWMLSVGLALSLLVSWLLARHLVAPILALSRHTRHLQEGHYRERLESRRRDELGTLIHQVNQLAERLQQGQAARQRWFSDIAHELRTPVAILQGELEALSDGIRPVNQQALAGLEGQVAHLTHLINDLHDLALADGGNLRYHFTALDFSALLEDALDSYASSFELHDIHCQTQLIDHCPIHGDPVRLRQLLDNLLQNSLKYTQAGGSLTVRLAADGNQWRLTLEDSAPGVPDDALPRLFDYLYRVDSSRNRRTGGSGLGLAICDRIVQAHGGQIHAAHSKQGGLRIDVLLPREAP